MTAATLENKVVTAVTRMPFDERRERLASEVSRLLALGNRRIESYSDLSAVIIIGKPVNHILHLLATVLTVGIWGFVWVLLVLVGGEKRELVRVDESGNVTVESVQF
jgi:hypothetical protein